MMRVGEESFSFSKTFFVVAFLNYSPLDECDVLAGCADYEKDQKSESSSRFLIVRSPLSRIKASSVLQPSKSRIPFILRATLFQT
jgi:hypothetical protein